MIQAKWVSPKKIAMSEYKEHWAQGTNVDNSEEAQKGQDCISLGDELALPRVDDSS